MGRGENIMGKHCWLPEFCPILTMFSKGLFLKVVKSWDCVAEVISLPSANILNWSKWRAYTNDKVNATEKWEICSGKSRKHSGKRRKCWSPAFSSFSTIFSKGFFFNVVESRNYVGKG